MYWRCVAQDQTPSRSLSFIAGGLKLAEFPIVFLVLLELAGLWVLLYSTAFVARSVDNEMHVFNVCILRILVTIILTDRKGRSHRVQATLVRAMLI